MAHYEWQLIAMYNNRPAGSYGIYHTRAEAEEAQKSRYAHGGASCRIKRILVGDTKKTAKEDSE